MPCGEGGGAVTAADGRVGVEGSHDCAGDHGVGGGGGGGVGAAAAGYRGGGGAAAAAYGGVRGRGSLIVKMEMVVTVTGPE